MKPPREIRLEFLDAAVELLGDRAAGPIAVRDGDVSMRPTLPAGRLLWVEFRPTELSAGDILLFRQQDYLVVHRLLGRASFPDGRPSLRTRGDGRNGLDPHLDPEKVIGRVVASRDDGGWWDLQSPGAHLFARAVAWHDLFWAAAGSAVGLLDRGVLRRTDTGPLRAAIAALDRGLLSLAHTLFFRLAHTRREDPTGAGAEPPAAILTDR